MNKRLLLFFASLMLLLTTPAVFAGETLVSPLKSTASVSSGYYIVMPKCAPSRALSMKGNSMAKYVPAVSRTYQQKNSQIFFISRSTNGTYTLRNKQSGLVLGVAGASTKSGTVVRSSAYCSLNSQRWYIIKRGGYYRFQAAMSKRFLTVTKSSKSNNAPVITYYSHERMAGQLWTLVRVGGSSDSNETEDEASSQSSSSSSQTTKVAQKYKTTTKKGMSDKDYDVLNNIIGAVETGGQVYGQRDYGDYTAPYTSSSLEHTCTLGWGAFYGSEAQYLIKEIRRRDPSGFKKIDKKGLIAEALKKNWVKDRWKPNAAEIAVLKKLIVTTVGKKVQDDMVKGLMKEYVSDCTKDYTSNTWAIMMYCEIRHLGGQSGADRIFGRCKTYTLDAIVESLKKDQADKSSSYQVGDSVFWSRHMKCVEFIQKYA